MVLRTERLVLRPPEEADRERFVELFMNDSFMVFSGALNARPASARFDEMLEIAAVVPFAKQPIVERESGNIIGYAGVGNISFEGVERLEWGWRLISEARGKGYATEAVAALLEHADDCANGEMLCLIAPENVSSRRVADKIGFRWQQQWHWDGNPDGPVDVLVRQIGAGGEPLRLPTQG